MCDECNACVKCVTLNVINSILTVIVVLMNGIYAMWGLFIPRSTGRTAWKDYAEKLEVYLDVVSYSDSILIPLKTVSMILVKLCCCESKKDSESADAVTVRADDLYDSRKYRSSPIASSRQYTSNVTVGGVSTFQLAEV